MITCLQSFSTYNAIANPVNLNLSGLPQNFGLIETSI
jgi:hypothetical protein